MATEIANEQDETIDSDPKSTTISASKLEKMKEARSLPPIPGKKPNLEEFNEWGKAVSEEGWNRLAPYVYRLIPVLNRVAVIPTQNKYIDILTKEAFVDYPNLREYFKLKHGGGKYSIQINDIELPKERSTIMNCIFNIPIDEKMPMIDYRELELTAKENLGYINVLRTQGISFDKDGNIVSTPNGIPSPSPDPSNLATAMGGMFKEFMGMFQNSSKEQQSIILKLLSDGQESKKGGGVQEILLERLKQDDPNKQITTMIALMTAIKQMSTNEGSQNNTDKLLQVMGDSHKAQMELMGKMIELTQSKKEDNFFDSLLKFATVKERLPEFFGGGQEPKKSNTELIIEGVKELGLPVLGIVSQYLQVAKGAKPIVPVTPQQAQEFVNGTGALPQPESNVVEMPTPPTPQQNQPTQSQDGVFQNNVPGALPLNPKNLNPCQQFIAQYGILLVNALNNPEVDGVSLAQSVVAAAPMMGQDFYSILKNQGKDNIIGSMKSIPEFWNATGAKLGEEKINEIIGDFLDYEEILKREQEEENESEHEGKGA